MIKLLLIAGLVLLSACQKVSHPDGDVGEYDRGITIFIDRLTGCHYIRSSFDAITPRMDSTGKQVCKESDHVSR